MSANDSNTSHGIMTAFPNYASSAQTQKSLPGLESKMEPLAEHIKVEKWDNQGNPYLEEYKGTGRLQGKNALITGGDSGIGRSVALFFAREGCNVTIAHLPEEQSDADDVTRLVAESPTGSKEILSIAIDLKSHDDCKRLVEKHVEKWGNVINIIVNNGAMQVPSPSFEEIDLNVTTDTFKTNIISMFAVVKFALPHFVRGSTVINSSSVTAYKGSAAMIDYSSTKGAINSFTRSLAYQLAPRGIRVNAVAPGPVYTPLQPASRDAEGMEDWAVGPGTLPLHGRPLQPSELGASYVYLADNGASNGMTGQVIHLNVGQWFGS